MRVHAATSAFSLSSPPVNARNASSSPAPRTSRPLTSGSRAKSSRTTGSASAARISISSPSRRASRTPGSAARSASGEAGAATDALAEDARLDLGRRTLGDDAPAVQEDDAVGERVRLLQVVGGEENGAAAGGARTDLRPERAPRLDVEPHGRLVEKEQVGIAAQSEGEEHPLALAARELAEQPVLQPLQAGGGEHLAPRQGVRVVAGDEVDVLLDLQRLGHLRDLEHGAHPHAGRGIVRRAAEQAGRACGRPDEAEQELHRRGLARAVGAEHGHHLPRAHREVDAGQGGDAAVFLDRAGQLGHRRAVCESLSVVHRETSV